MNSGVRRLWLHEMMEKEKKGKDLSINSVIKAKKAHKKKLEKGK